MLVLSRKANDAILLPGLDVAIEILEVKGKYVRVGIVAPSEIKILRGELLNADSSRGALLHCEA